MTSIIFFSAEIRENASWIALLPETIPEELQKPKLERRELKGSHMSLLISTKRG